jgi:predicted anti-sigma-YlaC factor YlaD
MILNELDGLLDSFEWVYVSEDDPELVRDAFPFNLKTIDILVRTNPDDLDLLIAASSGYAMYAFAFIMEDADRMILEDYQQGLNLYNRAKNLFNRSRAYGFRSLEIINPEINIILDTQPQEIHFTKGDVPALYWTAIAIAGSISASRVDPNYVVDLPKVGWLIEQCLLLDPDWNDGALYSVMISYSMNRPDKAANASQVAREYFEKSVAASGGLVVAPYVALAENVYVEEQNKKQFIEVLNDAIMIDVDEKLDNRLANIISQNRARWLLNRVDELFY